MTEANPSGNLGDVVSEDMPRIIKIRPGSASEKELMAVLPKELATATFDEVLRYISSDPSLNRKDERIMGRIKQEIANNYGINVGGVAAKKTDKIAGYFRNDVSPKGKTYQIAEFIVAADESGGALNALTWLANAYRNAA